MHPGLLRAARSNQPAGTQALLVELACQHVESTQRIQLCRMRRRLKVRCRSSDAIVPRQAGTGSQLTNVCHAR